MEEQWNDKDYLRSACCRLGTHSLSDRYCHLMLRERLGSRREAAQTLTGSSWADGNDQSAASVVTSLSEAKQSGTAAGLEKLKVNEDT